MLMSMLHISWPYLFNHDISFEFFFDQMFLYDDISFEFFWPYVFTHEISFAFFLGHPVVFESFGLFKIYMGP